MSKPKTETGRVLRTANNIVESFKAYNRAEVSEHETNALNKLDLESGRFIGEIIGMSAVYGFPLDPDINPTARLQSHINPHLDFMKQSLKSQYHTLLYTLDETRKRTVPRLTPGIFKLISEVSCLEQVTLDELAELENRFFDEKGLELRLFIDDFSSGSKTEQRKETIQEPVTIAEVLVLGLTRTWTPIYLERLFDSDRYVVSPLGISALEITSLCLNAKPQEPIAGNMLQYR